MKRFDISKFLDNEWVLALGCTEPAAIAYAAMHAARQLQHAPKDITLTCDPKIYKNCHAVGIPNSDHKTGIKWAAAIGVHLNNTEAGLRCFDGNSQTVIAAARKLIKGNKVAVKLAHKKTGLYIDIEASDGKNIGRCVIEDTHTNISLIEKNSRVIFKSSKSSAANEQKIWRERSAKLSPREIVKLARSISTADRKKIRSGAELNLKIARHGLKLFPKSFFRVTSDPLTRISAMVCAGVYARMWGEPFPVMSIAGSGNKGIVSSVPLVLLEKKWRLSPKRVEEAIAIALLFTSKTTYELGTLSAVCGCSNAAGIGLACAIVYLLGGGEKEISAAINNMVGNITGMICDGAKIGCALKTMTSVDAAFRSASLAISGIGIPKEDGIVGADGSASLRNLGAIAKNGMIRTDAEILRIMSSKL